MNLRVADISYYQNAFDHEKAQSSGLLDGLMIRSSEGIWTDGQFIHNRAEVKLPHGFYHAMTWKDPAKAQAEKWLKLIGDDPGEYPPALDIEKGKKGAPPVDLIDRALYILKTVSKAVGIGAILYSSVSFVKSYLWDPDLTEFGLWAANYGVGAPGLCWPWFPCQIVGWQFGIYPGRAYGTVPSYKGGAYPKIDLNCFYYDRFYDERKNGPED